MKGFLALKLGVAVVAVVGLLSAGVVSAGLLSAYAAQGSTVAYVSFGGLVRDEAIVELLDRYGVQAQRASIWTSGYGGGGGPGKPMPPREFVREMRTAFIERTAAGLEANTFRLNRLLQDFSEDAFTADASQHGYARALLTYRLQHERAIAAARSGNPLIYAMEVSADSPAKIASLRQDPMVTASVLWEERLTVPYTEKPESLQPEGIDPATRALSPQELYSRVRAVVAG